LKEKHFVKVEKIDWNSTKVVIVLLLLPIYVIGYSLYTMSATADDSIFILNLLSLAAGILWFIVMCGVVDGKVFTKEVKVYVEKERVRNNTKKKN
jgi:hypothetical protein